MKKQFGKNGFYLGPNNDLFVSLVSNQPEGDDNHNYDFVVFDLAQPTQNVGLVGVENGERFGFKFQMQHSQDRFAFAAYVDGVNVCQSRGLSPLSAINNPESYFEHRGGILIGISDYPKECIYVDTFVQKTNESRRLAFTHDKTKGVNYNLISEAQAMNKIEIFCWIERKVVQPEVSMSRGASRGFGDSAVGAGEATYKEYGRTSTLSNPRYIGKVTFIHLNAEILKHLGDRIVERPAGFSFNPAKDDIMNLVPMV